MRVEHVVTITLTDGEVRKVSDALAEVLGMTAGENFRSDPGVLRELLVRLAVVP